MNARCVGLPLIGLPAGRLVRLSVGDVWISNHAGDLR
jgi:hypothetical protein